MTELLDKAFKRAATLPASEQDRLAQEILAELEDEALWDERFGRSQDALGRLADAAAIAAENGRTEPLSFERG
ncbi:MAG: hypothetical protein U5R14_10620 [Gemmatimonadota bacterium]|nr:hypothetical protein [Gemmatimonadota bacterium]